MTKRFTYKASEGTRQLFSVQSRLRRARALVTKLEAEERGFKAFLLDFYDDGKTNVEYTDRRLEVTLSQYEMRALDQERAKTMIRESGEDVPYTTATVTKLVVHRSKK